MTINQPVNWVHEYQKMRDDRDRWRKIAERLAGWGDFTGEAECALHEYRQAANNE